ncbi:EAL domain-containing protein [Brevibacillus sp. SAFN-007a]|uniref:EAL domain-containing protein n=1 Tax=Brevibacillus sp. SAFN-007a TaxID=3436862 RepID=UPI003F7F2035
MVRIQTIDQDELDQTDEDLYQAIVNQELTLYYQPFFDLRTAGMTGVEVLARWHHAKWGLLPPQALLLLAKRSGVIRLLEEWVLRAACTQGKAWIDIGFGPLVVSVNLSAYAFASVGFADTIQKILWESQLPPRYLELEVTELAEEDAERTLGVLAQLKQLGVQVSLDDFGKYPVSIPYLSRVPADKLKLDPAMVQQAMTDSAQEVAVRTALAIARTMGRQVTAAGVESREQAELLGQLQCDLGQGNYFCEPLLADQLVLRMRSQGKAIVPATARAEQEASENRIGLSEVLGHQQGMTFGFRKQDGRFIHTFCAGELLHRIGLTPEQVVGSELCDIVPLPEAWRKTAYYERAWNGEENVTYEGAIHDVCYLATLRPVFREGQVEEVIASCVDITELRKAKETQRVSEAAYRLMVENISDIIVLIDCHGYVTYVSPSVRDVLEVSPETFLHRHLQSVLSSEQLQRVWQTFQEIREWKLPRATMFSCSHRNGSKLILEATGSPVQNEQAEVEQVVFLIRNRTAQVHAEEFLRKMDKLSVVGQLAAGVAHEIRNPITAIKGFVQLLRRDEWKSEYFDIMLAEFHQLESILREFVFLTQQRSHSFEWQNLAQLLQSIAQVVQAQAPTHQLMLAMDDVEETWLWCDQGQLKQVFIHLLSNAVESMPDGGAIRIRALRSGHDQVMIQIADRGCGMSEERLKRLGEPFYSTKEKGTGLGLMMTYKMIHDHDGSIHFSSAPGKGTTVEVYLPLNRPAGTA